MIKTLLVTSLILSSLSSFACQITSYPQIIKLNRVLDDSIIKESDCDRDQKQMFIQLISGADGELKAGHLTQIFKSEFKKDISISPEMIEVQSVKDVLVKLVQLPKSLVFSTTTSLYDKGSLNLEGRNILNATCANCESAGEKNIKVTVDNQTIWFSTKLLTQRVAYIATQSISPFQSKLSQDQFYEKQIFDNGRSHLFRDMENIRFYRPTRHLEKGKVLHISDFVQMTIVKPGQKVKVLLKGKSISLNSTALARQGGKIGQIIDVYNQKTNKKISGLVIDFNTVMVNL
jgi:flagella basal body P-ring formation protein FlgA